MELIGTRLNTTVRGAFRQFRRELLPREMQENQTVNWILSFDSLDGNNRDDDFRRRNNIGEGRGNLLFDLVTSQLVQNTLSANITFYYASLFHLGRQWQVSEQAAQIAAQALETDNLAQTVSQNIENLQAFLSSIDAERGEDRELVFEAISDVLGLAIENHRQKVNQAQQWWLIWRREAAELEEIVDEYVRAYNRFGYDYRGDFRRREGPQDRENEILLQSLFRLISYSFQTGRLYRGLKKEGISLKNIGITDGTQSPLSNSNFTQLLTLALFNGGDLGYEFRRFIDFYEHLLRTQEQILKDQRNLPVIQSIEARLLRDFEHSNLFEKYGLLKSPPDGRLRDLWNNCKLPDGKMFFYAENWINSLEREPSYWGSELPFKAQLTTEDIESYGRSADSAIKRNWVKESMVIGQTFSEFSQSLFEQKWVIPMMKGAVYPTKEKKGTQQWGIDSFASMIEKVVGLLNKRGYKLITPSRGRLKWLWDVLLKGGSTKDW